jgi:hypothetical protein
LGIVLVVVLPRIEVDGPVNTVFETLNPGAERHVTNSLWVLRDRTTELTLTFDHGERPPDHSADESE